MCFEGTGTLPGSDLMREINLGPAPPYIRPGAPEWVREKGTGGLVFVASCRLHCQGDMQSDRGYPL